MNTRHTLPFLLSLVLLLGVAACSKDDTTVSPPDQSTGKTITGDTLTGNIKGKMQAGKTYYLASDAFVQKGDTLTIEPGAHLVALGPSPSGVYTLFIRGALFANGSKDQMILMAPQQQYAGAWGGIQCDSPSVVSLKFCRIDYAGGLRPDGKPRPAIYYFSNAANTSQFILEDCILFKPKDDGFMIYGGKGSVLRNYFPWNGEVDGSGPNFKAGFKGVCAYNYIWSCVDQSIRVETSATVLYPQTDVEIYNNTIVNSGHKNPAKPGAGILIDKFARAKVYNNIFVNTVIGLRITAVADTANTFYGNNLFYTTIDSLRQNFYPGFDYGRPQSTDLIQVDPMFVKFNPDMNAPTDENDVHLKSGSPALGKGNPAYDVDLGAFTAKR
jgi:hypothetical protein